MQFSHIEYLYLLLLIPACVALFVWMSISRRRDRRRFGDESLVSRLMPEASRQKPILKFIILMLAYAFAVFGLAGPRFGTKVEEQKRKGAEIIVALDVSNSMLAQDIKPNRLERAKQALVRLIDRLGENKIGLIVFAGEAYTQLPLTNDYVSAKMFLSTITPKIVPVQGTAIGAAIKLAVNSFSPTSEAGKAIIIITDGENHEDNPEAEATQAAQKGINVYTVGVGSTNGTLIPAENGGFIKDRQGNVVMTQLNEEGLLKIAKAGNGIYVHATNSDMGLGNIFDEISNLDKTEYDAKIYTDFAEMFQWPFGVALFLLLVELLVSYRKSRLKLFA